MGRRTRARARRPLDTKSGGREAEREWHGRHMHRRCIDGKSLAYHETAVPRLAKVAPCAAVAYQHMFETRSVVCVICLSSSSAGDCTFDTLLVFIHLDPGLHRMQLMRVSNLHRSPVHLLFGTHVMSFNRARSAAPTPEFERFCRTGR